MSKNITKLKLRKSAYQIRGGGGFFVWLVQPLTALIF